MGGSNRKGNIMIPPAVVAALAPVVIDKFFGDAPEPAPQTGTYDPDAPPTADPPRPAPSAAHPAAAPVMGMVREYFDHEKTKAAVRPSIMKMSGQFTIFSAVCYVVAAFAPMTGLVTIEQSNHAMDGLLWAMGGGASFYGYKHTVRSVDKWGGKA